MRGTQIQKYKQRKRNLQMKQELNTDIENQAPSSSSTNKKSLIHICDGVASIVASLCFIIGFVLYATQLTDLVKEENTGLDNIKIIEENEGLYYLSNIIYDRGKPALKRSCR